MLHHPTVDKLRDLKLTGMLKAFEEQTRQDQYHGLPFEDRLGLLVDRELDERQSRRLQNRLKRAKLRVAACIEDIDFRQARGLDKGLMLQLASGQWIRAHDNVLITGPTGAGKTYLACALGHAACRQGYRTQYLRIPRLFEELAVARGDGRYAKLLRAFDRTDLLILDDWGTARLTDEQRKDLFEVLEDRYDRRSTLIAAQLPIEHWHELIGEPTLADAILDRLVHNAYKIQLKGDSMRKKRKPLNNTSDSGKK